MRTRTVSRVTAAVVVALALPACGGAADVAAPPPAVGTVDDPGAAARAAALARYDGGGRSAPVTATTPDVVGRTPEDAEALLAEADLDLRLVAYDRTQPITVQWPRAGQPVPLDRTIEGWLGEPPATEEPAVANPSPAPPAAGPDVAGAAAPAPSATPDPAPSPTSAPASTEVAASYVLPPHTDGLLRTNPRRLPALPLGTQLTGRASWYGPGFQGLTTACGSTFDMNAATIATRELRCGTVVRITGPTGRTVEATVTDWGPAEWTGRRFDLSAAVFNAIAPLGTGVIDVRVVTANVPG